MSTINVINGANSTQLDFDFSTINKATGSFTLNTAIQDSNPTTGAGLFQNAVTNVQYPIFGISDSGPLNVRTFNNLDVVIFEAQGLNQNDGSSLNVYLDYDNPDQLSNDPDNYFISQAGDFAGYGGGIGTSNSEQFSRIVGLNVTKLVNGTNQSDILLGTAEDDKLKGLNDDDLLFGNAGDDVLDGGSGKDRLFGGGGADKFVLKAGEGTDTIFDFQDGTDSLLLADGLKFENLTITQGSSQTSIKLTETNEVLVSLFGVQANTIGVGDFTTSLV